MKRLIFAILLIGLVACKKEEKIPQTNTTETTTPVPNLGEVSAEFTKGKTIFTDENGNSIIVFDNQANKGVIRLNDKEISFENLSFTENQYEMSNENISILAENGTFQDQKDDCIEGEFPTIIITIDGKDYTLKNVKVKDCRVY